MDNYIQKGTNQYWRAISALFLGSLAAFGSIYCTQPLIPVFSGEFSLEPAVASLAMSSASGGMAVSMFAIACLADSLHRKLTMVISLSGAALLVIPIVLSSDFITIVICRAAQGILAAGFPAIAMAYINEEFAPEIRGLVIGIYISGTSIGGLTSRLIVSTITDYFTWKLALIVIGIAGFFASAWFYLAIPKSKHFLPQHHSLQTILADFGKTLRHPVIIRLYLIAFAIMGCFMAIYNYIGYPLMAPPYNLSQTAIGGLFMLYLIGTFSSTVMGGMSDRFGSARILSLSILTMFCGGLITLLPMLAIKIIGLAIFTFGFFGSHSVASSWVGKCCQGDKARAASLYLLFYYFGAGIVGTAGGIFLSQHGWPGVILVVGLILGGALLLSKLLSGHIPILGSQIDH